MEHKHPTYTIVKDAKEADAVGWGFYTKDASKPEKVYFKFPPLKDDEIRIQVTWAGLCHSELHTVQEDWGPVKNRPIIPGHETVGVITHLGKDVKDFKLGDRVGFGTCRDFCAQCRQCGKGNNHLCTGQVDQAYTYGELYWGGYATSLQQPSKLFFKLPENLPEEDVPPLFCAGVTLFSPVAKFCKPGDEVAVAGIGGLGHLGVMYAKAWGCKVTALTSSANKNDLLKKLGADKIVVVTEEGALEKEAGKYDVILNSLPVADAKMFQSYFALLGPEGKWVQLGAPNFAETVPFYLGSVVFGEKMIVGSLVGSKKTVQDMLDFSSKHNIVPMCEKFEFEDFPQAWEKLRNGRPQFRCVVKFKDGLKQ